VDTVGEVLVFGRIRNEARVILESLIGNRRKIFNKAIWQPDPAQKRERQRTGFFKCSMVDDTRTKMGARFQAGYAS
jgi:hypothetical protein